MSIPMIAIDIISGFIVDLCSEFARYAVAGGIALVLVILLLLVPTYWMMKKKSGQLAR